MDESVVKHLEQQQGTLRLSEAIRIGATAYPVCRGVWYDGKGGACAATSAAWVTGMSERHPYSMHIEKHFAKMGWPDLINEISYMNARGASGESIAVWLAAQGL